MNTWSDWLKIIQMKPRFLFGLWFLGSLVLFLPNEIANAFGIQDIRSRFQGYIGVGTLAAFAFWCVQLIPIYQSRKREREAWQKVIDSIKSLSPEEWLLVAYCLARNQKTITLEITHRAAGALATKGILIMSSGVGNKLAWPFTIPDFLWAHFKANPQLIFDRIEVNDPLLQARFEELEKHIKRYDYL